MTVDKLPAGLRWKVEDLIAAARITQLTDSDITLELVYGRGLRVKIYNHESRNLGIIPLSSDEQREIRTLSERPSRKLTRRSFGGAIIRHWDI